MSYSATITYKSFLMVKKNTAYTKLVDIKDYPDILAAPENVETTTLSDAARTYIDGISGADGNMDFTVNYDMDAVEAIEGVMGSIQDIAVWFGGTDGTAGADPTPTGDLGKFGGKGKISYTISGKGVNEVREIVVHVTPTSAWARITE